MHTVGDAAISRNIVDGPFGTQLKVEEYQPFGIRLIRVSNCRSGEVLDDDEMVYISEEKHQQLIRSEVLPGDVLLTKAGHILGYTAVFPKEMTRGNITSHLAAIRPSDGIVSEFLAVYLSSSLGLRQIYRWGNKATRPELNTDEVREILVPVPPLGIQRALVAEMQAAHEARKQKLAQADALLAGLDEYLLQQLRLTPPIEDKRQVFAVTRGQIKNRIDTFFYTPFLRKTEEAVRAFKPKVVGLSSLLRTPPLNGLDARDYEETGQRYLRVQNVKPYELVLDDVKFVSVTTEKGVALKAGDVLLTRKGTFGVAATVPQCAEDCLISSEIILLRLSPKADCSPEHLVAWLNSSMARTLLDRYKAGGIMGHLTQDVVSEFPVPIPTFKVQQRIVGEVEQRRDQARRLREEAVAEWEAAKARFEQKLLGEA